MAFWNRRKKRREKEQQDPSPMLETTQETEPAADQPEEETPEHICDLAS